MRSYATIEYNHHTTTKEEAMLKVELKAFSQIAESLREKEFKYLKISTNTIKLFDFENCSKARCSIYLEEA